MTSGFRSLGLAGLLFLVGASSASALAWNDTDRSLPKPDRDAFIASAQRLQGLLATRPSPPRLSDPAVRDFQDQALALSRVIRTKATPVTAPSDLFTLCQPAAEIFQAYVGAGGASTEAEIDRNAALYIDESMPPLLFTVHCMADVLPLLEQFVVDSGDNFTASQGDGAKLMRGGLFKIVTGMAIMLDSGALGANYQERFIDLLAQDADGLAPYLSLSQRAELVGRFGPLARAAPRSQADRYARLLAALRSTDCGRICSF